MRKLILSMQMSLDGFVEGEKGDSSWMNTNDPEDWSDLFKILKSVDLIILGRVMWPDYRDHWKKALTSRTAPANEVKYAKLAEKTPHIVFSKTIKDPDPKNIGWSNARIVSGGIVKEVKKLKKLPGKSIMTFGGARFARTLINAGLVDEYRLAINPAIVTKGKSILKDLTRKHTFVPATVNKTAGGLIIVTYKEK